jgi:cellulose biosynthesis protein BcsQ
MYLNVAAFFDRYDQRHVLLLDTDQLNLLSSRKLDRLKPLKKSHNRVSGFCERKVH